MSLSNSSNDDDYTTSLDENPMSGASRSRLAELYGSYFDRLVLQLRARYGSGPPDPSDIAQATFEKLSQHNMLEDVENLEAYSWTTANNLIRNEYRALLVRSSYAKVEASYDFRSRCDEFTPERVVMAREELEIVLDALRQMPERRRNVFIACRIDGLNPRQAGERLGISRTAVVRHLALATEFLATQLESRDPGDAA
ncbi:MAG: sigma-70 family RNA polymerase sigma factor [Pseudomonadota bacterium]